MEINALLKVEAKKTAIMQGQYKAIVLKAIDKHGLDRDAIMKDIKPKIARLAKGNVDLFLKMGIAWLK